MAGDDDARVVGPGVGPGVGPEVGPEVGPGVGPEVGHEVGYAKPPRHTRFRPGQSGNPAGRPKGPRSLGRDLIEELHEPVALGEGETREILSKQRSILRALTAKALAGDPKATAMVLELVQRLTWAGGGIRAIMARED